MRTRLPDDFGSASLALAASLRSDGRAGGWTGVRIADESEMREDRRSGAKSTVVSSAAGVGAGVLYLQRQDVGRAVHHFRANLPCIYSNLKSFAKLQLLWQLEKYGHIAPSALAP